MPSGATPAGSSGTLSLVLGRAKRGRPHASPLRRKGCRNDGYAPGRQVCSAVRSTGCRTSFKIVALRVRIGVDVTRLVRRFKCPASACTSFNDLPKVEIFRAALVIKVRRPLWVQWQVAESLNLPFGYRNELARSGPSDLMSQYSISATKLGSTQVAFGFFHRLAQL